jgi:hypothetical protein
MSKSGWTGFLSIVIRRSSSNVEVGKDPPELQGMRPEGLVDVCSWRLPVGVLKLEALLAGLEAGWMVEEEEPGGLESG